MADKKDKPASDEQTLGRLLEAAFVLQEHSEELRQIKAELERKAKAAAEQDSGKTGSSELESKAGQSNSTLPREAADYSSTLAEIVDIQRHVQQLSSAEAMSLVAEQVTEICGAAGAAIGIVNGKTVKYEAVAGIRALPAGSSVPLEKALCFPCIRTGQAFSCSDTKPEILIDTQECKRRGIGSLIAVPVFHKTGIVGGLELYFSDARAFNDEDVHTCQLMAALVTEGLVNEKDGHAPQLAIKPVIKTKPGSSKAQPSRQVPSDQMNGRSEVSPALCYKCGHQLLGEEQFCGECGAARSSAGIEPSLQSKVASLWHMQEAEKSEKEKSEKKEKPQKRLAKTVPAEPDSPRSTDATPERVALTSSSVSLETALQHSPKLEEAGSDNDTVETKTIADGLEDADTSENQESEVSQDSNQELVHSADWSSALSAKEFFEQFAAGNRKSALIRFWNTRRGDIYLAIAVLLVAGVVAWGIRSSHAPKAAPVPKPTAAAPVRKRPAPPQISLFDRMLISIGLAEAPQPPEYKGNPSAQVWEDLRTGLYYCPGTDMYGKTQKGKYTSQRDAQLDRFEPAYRKACD